MTRFLNDPPSGRVDGVSFTKNVSFTTRRIGILVAFTTNGFDLVVMNRFKIFMCTVVHYISRHDLITVSGMGFLGPPRFLFLTVFSVNTSCV